MKKIFHFTIFGIAVLLLTGCFDERPNLVDARNLALFIIDAQVVDEFTGEGINFKLRPPSPKFAEAMRSSGHQKGYPILAEVSTDGRLRMTWIDFHDHYAEVAVTADGYLPRVIPEEYYQKVFYTESHGGLSDPSLIKLRRAEPDEGDNSE